MITRVIDGDSLEVTLTRVIDLGFRDVASVSRPVKLRLARINTPKLSSEKGKAASAFVTAVARDPCLVETFRTYKYGGGDRPEWMAEVTLETGQNLADVLVENGLATYWDGEGPRPNDF